MGGSAFSGGLGSFCIRGQTTAIDLTSWDDSKQRISGLNENRRRDLKTAKAALELRFRAKARYMTFRCLKSSIGRPWSDCMRMLFFLFADEYYDLLANELADEVRPDHCPRRMLGLFASAIFSCGFPVCSLPLGSAVSNDEGRRFGAATL